MKTFLFGLALLLAGCASEPVSVSVGPLPNPPSSSNTPATRAVTDPSDGWIKGVLTCVEDSTVYSFRIQKKIAWGGSATGGVVALNAATSTRLSGQYTGILPGGHASAWANVSGWNSNGGYSSASGSAYGTWQGNIANTQATLSGDGLLIQLALQIHAGWSPHGIGQGIDSKGRHYSVQF